MERKETSSSRPNVRTNVARDQPITVHNTSLFDSRTFLGSTRHTKHTVSPSSLQGGTQGPWHQLLLRLVSGTELANRSRRGCPLVLSCRLGAPGDSFLASALQLLRTRPLAMSAPASNAFSIINAQRWEIERMEFLFQSRRQQQSAVSWSSLK